jgi:heat shock protein HslJ
MEQTMKINQLLKQLLILLLAMVVVACAPAAQEGGGLQATQEPTQEPTILPTEENDDATSGIQPDEALQNNPLLGTDWNLVSLNGKTPAGDITLKFDDQTVGGSDGCNGYGATYTVDGDVIAFDTSGFMSTMMACEPMAIMDDGSAYLNALATATRFELGSGTLIIKTEQGELGFAIPENLTLEGTKWTLAAIAEANGIVSMAIDQDIYLLLENGVVAGSTGCNAIGGSYVLGGDELSFDQLNQTLMACLDEAVNQREVQFVDVLNRTARYTISRQTLTLEDIDGNLLATFSATNMSEEEKMGEQTNRDINGTSWTIDTIYAGDRVSDATISARFENGQLSGSAGCNQYMTSYLVDGDKLTLEAIATTRKMCDELTNADEQAFLQALEESRSFIASAELLTLNDAKGNPLLTFVPVQSVEQTLYVGAEQADCIGVAPQKCLLVKEDPNGEYLFFYDTIAGFEWEAGFEYVLRVQVTEINNPPADGSMLQYELIEVVSKTAVDG